MDGTVEGGATVKLGVSASREGEIRVLVCVHVSCGCTIQQQQVAAVDYTAVVALRACTRQRECQATPPSASIGQPVGTGVVEAFRNISLVYAVQL